MNWDNVRVFLAVARTGQFLAAGRQLNLDHATVSRRISGLEAALGSRLFERGTQGCALTPAGERFILSAERIETELLQAQSELSSASLDIAGTVRIGAPDGFGAFFLSPRLGRLSARHPKLNVQLVPVPRTFSLSKREADVSIVIDRPEAGRVTVRKLTDYTLHFYAARAYVDMHGQPATLDDLVRHPIVTYVPDLIFSEALNFMPGLFDNAYRRFENASAVGQTEAVRAGAGIGILHDYHARTDPALVTVLPDICFKRAYWIVTHADTRDMLRVRTIVDFIAAEVSAARHSF